MLNVEVTQIVRVLRISDDTNEIAELRLLQELLGQVLEVTLGESGLGNNGELLGIASDADEALEFTSLTGLTGNTNLDVVVQELFEGFEGENLVINGLSSVDNELVLLGGNLLELLLMIGNDETW